jgi:hypothetical protein
LHITGWDAIFVKILEGSQHFIFADPKAPFSVGPTTKKQRPRTASRNIQKVSLIGFGTPTRSGSYFDSTAWGDIVVPPFKHEADEIASVIVEKPLIVRTNPMVNSD